MRKLGNDISDARRRHRVTVEIMAERAGLSRATISKIEKGDPTASMGAYGSVLFVLGLADRLNDLADAAPDRWGLVLMRRAESKKAKAEKRTPITLLEAA